MPVQDIKPVTRDETVNIVFDTLEKDKQALIFVSSKASAEKTAEEIARKIKTSSPHLLELSEKIERTLSSPTKQCRRLAKCIKSGIAFHHAGLVQKQKEAIEDAFRAGLIKIIAATPTLAVGVDLPSYRTIIKSLKRYSGRFGMQYIPVLEYHQMAGRSGRPGKDTRGEAITIAKNEADKNNIYERYIIGDVEEVYSKLAVEPVLRTYLLSLIASNFVRNKKDIHSFFEKTFWAHQFEDMERLSVIINKMLRLLEDYRFIQCSANTNNFVSAEEMMEESYKATPLGQRVSQLYLDPLTANKIITSLEKAHIKKHMLNEINLLQLFSDTLELKPLLRVKTKDYDIVEEKYLLIQNQLITEQPTTYDFEYEEYLNSIKTTMFFCEWIDEKTEEYVLEKFSVRPGEIRDKMNRIDWLCYGTIELCKIIDLKKTSTEINKLRRRLKYGVREELLALLKLKNVGRVRARKLFFHKIKNLGDVKKVPITTLTQLLGAKLAVDIKRQVGENVDNIEIKPTKRKGQMSLGKYA